MHKEASDYVFKTFHEWRGDRTSLKILEVGSYNINGSVRDFLRPFSLEYVGIDPNDGPNVDVVASGEEYVHAGYFDVVVTTETFEHAPNWKTVVQKSYENLADGGVFIATMAGEGRPPHSALDEKPIRDWEHYANIGEWDLAKTLRDVGFTDIRTNKQGTDLRCVAIKGAK